MNRRRITLTLGAAASAAAFLPMAHAAADTTGNSASTAGDAAVIPAAASPGDALANFTGTSGAPPVPPTTGETNIFGFEPVGHEEVLGVNGIPPLFQDTFGFQEFEIPAATPPGSTGSVSGSSGVPIVGSVSGSSGTAPVPGNAFDADVNHLTTPFGFSNTEIAVVGPAGALSVSSSGGAPPVPAEGVPGDGSVFDVSHFFGFTNVYSDVVGTNGTDTITDTLITPSGQEIDIPTSFSAALNPEDTFPYVTGGGDFVDFGPEDGGVSDVGSDLGSVLP
jgi:hypothetical protein